MTDSDIPKLIKELRERLGLTQEQFAQRVGVTFSSVNHWENGKRMPQPFLVKRLLELKNEIDSGGHGTGRAARKPGGRTDICEGKRL